MKFWALKENDEILNELLAKIQSYDDYLESSGIVSKLRDSYNTYYGDTKIRDVDGQQALRINHFASLVRSLNALVTSQKISWQAVASNTDVTSQQACILSNALLEFYLRDRRLDKEFKNAALMASFLMESWMSVEWNTQLGSIIAVDEAGAPVQEGDLEFKLFGLENIIRDFNRFDSNHDFVISRSYKNRFDLIAQYPEYESEILSITLDPMKTKRNRINVSFSENETDLIPYYVFYHKQTAALPNGRMIAFVDTKILLDTSLPYPRIPIIRLSPEETFNSCFGNSPMMDLLPLQHGIDTLSSTILTNNSAFGVQSVVVDKGSGISVNQVATGLNFIEVNPGSRDPRPLQLSATSSDTYRFLDLLVSQSQTLSGINSAVRGEAGANMSGSALALLANQAIQFANGLQQSYVSLSEDIGTLAINILQQYANTKRVAQLVGKNSQPLLKEWSSQDIRGVSKVTIESGNPLAKTLSGRLQIAQDLMQQGMIENPQQYLMVLETGRLEPVFEGTSRQLQLIRSENEKLSNGSNRIRALITDDHDSHILEHASVLSSPEVRENPNSPTVANTLAHIQEHIQLLKTVDPALLAILKQQPIPPSAPQNQTPQMMNSQNPVETEAGNVNLPSFPADLMNGGKFVPPNQ